MDLRRIDSHRVIDSSRGGGLNQKFFRLAVISLLLCPGRRKIMILPIVNDFKLCTKLSSNRIAAHGQTKYEPQRTLFPSCGPQASKISSYEPQRSEFSSF